MTDVEHTPATSVESVKPMYTHYLVTILCEGEPIHGRVLADTLSGAFGLIEIQPKMAVSYVSRYPVSPQNIGLKDTWLALTQEQRERIVRDHPHLARALDLLCGITQPELAARFRAEGKKS